MPELYELVRLLQTYYFLCLPCVAATLKIERSEADALVERLRDKMNVTTITSTCPRCAETRPVITLW